MNPCGGGNEGFIQKRLNVGTLIKSLSRALGLSKRMRESITTRLSLSVHVNDPFIFAHRILIEMRQSSSQYDDEKLLSIIFEWLRTSPSVEPRKHRVVPVLNNIHGKDVSTQIEEVTTAAQDLVIASEQPTTTVHQDPVLIQEQQHDPDQSEPSPSSRVDSAPPTSSIPKEPIESVIARSKRFRFSQKQLRTSTQYPWKCPNDNGASCTVCIDLWQRRRPCLKKQCTYQHVQNCHPILNSVENRLMQHLHVQKDAPTNDVHDSGSESESSPCKRARVVSTY